MFVTKKINNVKVKAINLPVIEPSKIKGYDVIPEIHANIYLVAHKKSGKTTCIFKLLKECSNKDTKLVFFGSTIYNDPAYEKILEHFEKRGNPVMKFTSIVEDGVDLLHDFLDVLKENKKQEKEQEQEDEEPESPKPIKLISVDNDIDEKEKDVEVKQRKPRKVAPEYIFIFDDLGKRMRLESFTTFIKTNRHYNCKTIISSQNVKDIQPDARENINFLILFKDINNDLLETIHDEFSIKMPYPTFLELYKYATNPKWAFLYIDRNNHMYRQNFNTEIQI